MATLNANPTVYAPLQIERQTASSHSATFKTAIKSAIGYNSNALSTLTNVKTYDIKHINDDTSDNVIDDNFSSSKYSELYAAASCEDTNETFSSIDPWDSLEVFDLVRSINDPEHPLTLEALKVLQLELIDVDDNESSIDLRFTPTIPHCSMATLIGLCIRVRLIRSLPTRFKVAVSITPGAHATEDQINKQLNDKERVAAALENNHLLDIVNKCLDTK